MQNAADATPTPSGAKRTSSASREVDGAPHITPVFCTDRPSCKRHGLCIYRVPPSSLASSALTSPSIHPASYSLPSSNSRLLLPYLGTFATSRGDTRERSRSEVTKHQKKNLQPPVHQVSMHERYIRQMHDITTADAATRTRQTRQECLSCQPSRPLSPYSLGKRMRVCVRRRRGGQLVAV